MAFVRCPVSIFRHHGVPRLRRGGVARAPSVFGWMGDILVPHVALHYCRFNQEDAVSFWANLLRRIREWREPHRMIAEQMREMVSGD